MKTAAFLPILLLLAACTSKTGSLPESGTIEISAVQFEVREEIYIDSAAFEGRIEKLCREIMEEFGPDLIVFPEYSGAFLALSDYSSVFSSVSSLSKGLNMIRKIDPEITSLNEVFLSESERVGAALDRIFGGLSREFGVYIIGGSYFHNVRRKGGREKLVNRLVAYNPRGERFYVQDKVFLTPFEQDILQISPGELPEDPGIVVDNIPIVFTICRDAFFEEWEQINGGGYVWIDIKANGAIFDGASRANFQKALPERLRESGVPYGITVALTGGFMELFWEGRSSMHRSVSGDVYRIAATESWTDQEILHISIPLP